MSLLRLHGTSSKGLLLDKTAPDEFTGTIYPYGWPQGRQQSGAQIPHQPVQHEMAAMYPPLHMQLMSHQPPNAVNNTPPQRPNADNGQRASRKEVRFENCAVDIIGEFECLAINLDLTYGCDGEADEEMPALTDGSSSEGSNNKGDDCGSDGEGEYKGGTPDLVPDADSESEDGESEDGEPEGGQMIEVDERREINSQLEERATEVRRPQTLSVTERTRLINDEQGDGYTKKGCHRGKECIEID